MNRNREFARQFVKPAEELDSWSRIEPYFVDLEQRSLETLDNLETWLLDWSELAACIDEVGTDRYVRMTCQTDDPARKQAYLEFIEQLEPKCKPRWHAIEVKYAACPAARQLPSKRFEVFDRSVQTRVSLFREENVPLQVEEAKLEQRYQELSGAMTASYDGREQTLQQLAAYQERTDRGVRQTVWELCSRRRLQDAEVLEDLFDELVTLRQRIARNADLPDYRAYAFKAKQRFDYTPEDCLAFHGAIEEACVGFLRNEQRVRQRKLGVAPLRPWDLAVDCLGRPPLRPFETSEQLIAGCGKIMDRIDGDLQAQFEDMAARGDLDLDSRKGKAPGGYQSTYHESRRPFIFMNAVGMQRDVRTMLHETGHAFHSLACRFEPLLPYRSSPIEFAEVASMGMELLAYEHLDVFYRGEDLTRARRQQLESILNLFPWVATIDAFQHWLYTRPAATREERRAEWLRLHRRFGGLEDYGGHEETLARSWQKQLHLFEVPFYYIEYALAQLGALQVWHHARRDREGAIAAYRRALALGGSRPLPELFEAAGIRFDFSAATLQPLIEEVAEELRALDE